ncbi:peroxide stress protein YaaA, partial [Acinetobacter baumannii]
GTDLPNGRGRHLYDFWGDRITEALQAALAAQGDEVLVNLASNEYFRSVNTKKLQARVITPQFRDEKSGQYKMISFFAKKARGRMSAWLL